MIAGFLNLFAAGLAGVAAIYFIWLTLKFPVKHLGGLAVIALRLFQISCIILFISLMILNMWQFYARGV